jgi:hypothetical protein
MGFVAFAAGFVLGTPAASAKADRLADRPIVDPHAWEISAPQAPPPPRIEIADCSPWDVSDTAMEGVLDEMQRRGWRPPREVEEILADVDLARAWREDAAQVGAESQASIEVVSDTESARLWNDAETGAPLAPQPASLVGAN